MIAQRIAFGGVAVAVLALVLLAVRAGWYPSHGRRVTRAENPMAFWVVMSLGVLFAAVFLTFGLAWSGG